MKEPSLSVVFLALLSGGVALATAFRAMLTAQVPPRWLTLPAKYRPLAAAGVSAVLVLLAGVQAGQSWQAAAAAAVGVLVASVVHLMAVEGATPDTRSKS